MRDDILSYREMCERENAQALQRGMNFRLRPTYSVVLMSRRPNAPYSDRILEDGITIEYEGHDIPRATSRVDPKEVDQPQFLPTGKPTQNGLFVQAIEESRQGTRSPEVVRVYEKVFRGVWSDKGFFELVNYKAYHDERRAVFKFYLKARETPDLEARSGETGAPSRLIPSEVKKEVWKRDKGRCVICGSTDNLHFDHDIPWSKGGSSLTARNVKVLCARHNIQKRDRIE